MDVVLALFAGTVLLLGLASELLRRNALSPVLLALVVGAAVGPSALGWVDFTGAVPRAVLLEEVSRITLALAVGDIGLMIGRRDLRDNGRRVTLLLTVGMLGMWLATAAGAWLMLGLPIAVALLLGAALTPTDPAVAAGLVSGQLPMQVVPHRVRRTLQLESGSNDGLALPLVLLAGLLATQPLGTALSDWVVAAVREIVLAVGIGAALGWVSGMLARHATKRVFIAESFLPLLGIAGSLLTLALVHLAGGSGILGAFVAGLVMAQLLPESERQAVSSTLSATSRLAVVATFGVFGTVLPWSAWGDLGWLGIAFAAWVLLLRRPPVVWTALLASDTGRLSRAYLAWFGPVGVAGIYYVAFAERYGLPRHDTLFAAGSLAICASVLAHTLTSSPAVRGYGRRAGTGGQDADEPAGAGGRLP